MRHGRLCSAVEAVFQKVGREPASAGHVSWASSRNLVPPAPSPPLPTSSGPAHSKVAAPTFVSMTYLDAPGGDSTLSGAKATQGRASGTRNNDPHCEIPIRRPWFRGREGTRPGRPQGPRSAAEACLSSSLVALHRGTRGPWRRGRGGQQRRRKGRELLADSIMAEPLWPSPPRGEDRAHRSEVVAVLPHWEAGVRGSNPDRTAEPAAQGCRDAESHDSGGWGVCLERVRT